MLEIASFEVGTSQLSLLETEKVVKGGNISTYHM